MYEKEKKECSKILYEASRKTWKNREGIQGKIDSLYDDFFGVRSSVLSGSGIFSVRLDADGVGTKIEIAERLSEIRGNFSPHRTIFHDLVAMICDDSACRFGEPFALLTFINANRPNVELVKELAAGMIDAADKAKVAVIGGEFAITDRVRGYGKYNYILDGVVAGLFDRWNSLYSLSSLIFLEEKLKTAKDSENFIVALQENGPRSNGYTDIRKALMKYAGLKWHEKEYEGKNLAEWFLEPSTIYTRFLVELHKNLKYQRRIYGAAHVTSGGIPEKLGRLLGQTRNLGALIDEPYEPPDSLLFIQKISRMPDRIAYQTFGMGHGVLMITSDANYVMNVAKEHGINSKVVGKLIREPVIKITSKGLFSKGEDLKYEIK